MKKRTLTVVLVAVAALAGCAVVPAYGPAYYEPAPYYGARPYYRSPTWVVPAPLMMPGHGHRGRHHWR